MQAAQPHISAIFAHSGYAVCGVRAADWSVRERSGPIGSRAECCAREVQRSAAQCARRVCARNFSGARRGCCQGAGRDALCYTHFAFCILHFALALRLVRAMCACCVQFALCAVRAICVVQYACAHRI